MDRKTNDIKHLYVMMLEVGARAVFYTQTNFKCFMCRRRWWGIAVGCYEKKAPPTLVVLVTPEDTRLLYFNVTKALESF